MCVPWELNTQPFALLTQRSATEPQEHYSIFDYSIFAIMEYHSMRASSREKVSSARGTSQSRSSIKQIHTLSAFTSTPDKGGAEWLLESESVRLRPDMLSAFSNSHVAAWSNWPVIQHTHTHKMNHTIHMCVFCDFGRQVHWCTSTMNECPSAVFPFEPKIL